MNIYNLTHERNVKSAYVLYMHQIHKYQLIVYEYTVRMIQHELQLRGRHTKRKKKQMKQTKPKPK